MRVLQFIAILGFSACCVRLPSLPPKRFPAIPASPAMRFQVRETYSVWHDARRNRDVPVKIYSPVASGKLPVVIVSHGIGEDRDSYAYLGRALAERGFIAVHITHAGTDRAVLSQGYRHIYEATREKINWINRPLDVSFVIDQLSSVPSADVSRVAVAGHSAGAFTGLAVAGMSPADGESLRDDRVRAVIAMSMPRMDGVIPPRGYDAIRTPVLNVTGTCDGSIIYQTSPRDRRVPFDSTHATRQYLVTLRGVNHNSFSNVEDEHHAVIAALTVAFARAVLLDDRAAAAWFDDAGSTRDLTVERK